MPISFVIWAERSLHRFGNVSLIVTRRPPGGLFFSVKESICCFNTVKQHILSFHWSPEKNSRECAERCFFDVERVAGRSIRPTIVSIIEVPGCFVGPTFRSLSGRFASLQKKDERQRPRVFLSVYERKTLLYRGSFLYHLPIFSCFFTAKSPSYRTPANMLYLKADCSHVKNTEAFQNL